MRYYINQLLVRIALAALDAIVFVSRRNRELLAERRELVRRLKGCL
jgi:hypothetical protein